MESFIPRSSPIEAPQSSDQADQVSLHANGESVLRRKRKCEYVGPKSTAIHTRRKLTNKSKCEFHTTSSKTASHDPEFAYLQYSIGFLEGKRGTHRCAGRVATCLVNSPSLCTFHFQTGSRVNERPCNFQPVLEFLCRKRNFVHPTADKICVKKSWQTLP